MVPKFLTVEWIEAPPTHTRTHTHTYTNIDVSELVTKSLRMWRVWWHTKGVFMPSIVLLANSYADVHIAFSWITLSHLSKVYRDRFRFTCVRTANANSFVGSSLRFAIVSCVAFNTRAQKRSSRGLYTYIYQSTNRTRQLERFTALSKCHACTASVTAIRVVCTICARLYTL